MSTPQRVFAPIEEAIEDIRAGRMVVVCDDEDRENEGDLTLAAQFATPEAINFMATYGRGLVCLALTPDRCDELGLDLMAAKNETPLQTAFTVAIEARDGVTTGISAADRAHTIQVAVDGVSLTVAEEGEGWFSVALIPETLERTTLGGVAAGTKVNLEVDVLAKYVEKLVTRTVEAK